MATQTPTVLAAWVQLLLLLLLLSMHACIHAQHVTPTAHTHDRNGVVSSTKALHNDADRSSVVGSSAAAAAAVVPPAPPAPTARARFDAPAVRQLHAVNYRELWSPDVNEPRCAAARDLNALRRQCELITRQEGGTNEAATMRQRIALAFTECHVARNSYIHVKSCQASDDVETCIKDMNRDGTVFTIYTSFFQSIDSICNEVDEGFMRRKATEVVQSVLSATMVTAEALNKLEKSTFDLTRDLEETVKGSSAAIINELLEHSVAESRRFEQLKEATSDIAEGQASVMDHLKSNAEQLQSLLLDAELTQRMLNATSQEIVASQAEVLSLQKDAVQASIEARQELQGLKNDQIAGFQSALDSLTTIKALQDKLAEAQMQGKQALDALSRAQAGAFEAASQRLDELAKEQAGAFQRSQQQLDTLTTLQGSIATEQGHILNTVKTSSEEVRRLSDEQAKSFATTADSLSSIARQAAEAEKRVGVVLGEVKHIVSQILNINLDMIAELFKIESAFFYLAFAPLVYLLTATDRTHGARFYIFALLLIVLMVELNLVTAAQRFHYHLSQPQFDAVRCQLRYALCVLSLLLLSLSALFHHDYPQLSYSLQSKSARVLANNHRMLHELLRRTESPPPSMKPAFQFQPNEFQQYAPPSWEQENPSAEGQRPSRPARAAPHHRRAATMPNLHNWQHIDVECCCPDQQPTRSWLQRFGSWVRGLCSTQAASFTANAITAPQASPALPVHTSSPSPSPPIASPKAALVLSPGAAHSYTDEDGGEQSAAEEEEEQADDGYSSRSSSPPRRVTRSRSRSVSRTPARRAAANRAAATETVEEEGDEEGEEEEETEPGVQQKKQTKTQGKRRR